MIVRASAVLSALAVLLCAAPSARSAPAAERAFSPAELKADFTALYDGLKQAQYDLYLNIPKAELDRLHARDLSALDRPMTKSEAAIRFQTFVSRVRVAHTRIDFPDEVWAAYRDGGGRAFPLSVRVVGQRVYVTENNSGVESFGAGDELARLNGRPIGEWIERVSRHISADTPYMAGSLLEFWLPRLLWVELGPVDGFDLEVRRADGRTLMLRLPARTREEMRAAAAARPPAFTFDADKREHRLLEGGVGYLKPGPFYNPDGPDMWDASSFTAFVDGAFESLIASGVDSLIIDLRQNPGGDNSFSDPIVAWFADRPFRFFSEFRVRVSPQAVAANQRRIDAGSGGAGDTISHRYARLYGAAKPGDIVRFDMPWARPRPGRRFTGKVYLLVDRHSYSNTVTVAALVQDNGFGRILGEETSDMATTHGAMEQFALPNTGILVGFAKAHIIRPNGDTRVRGVTPDVAIETPIGPTATDVMLERALEVVRRER